MSFRTMLVFVDDTEASARRLETALEMARKNEAHLAACALVEQPEYYYGIGTEVAADVYLEDVERAKAEAQRIAEATRERLMRAGHSGEARWATGSPGVVGEIAARQARYADLTFVGQPAEGPEEALLTRILEGVLFDSGRPLVMIPRDWQGDTFGSKVMIGWNASREAARAVADAMPFIEAAGEVTVALVDPKIGEDAHGEEPGADLAAALAHHDVEVTVDRLPSEGRSVAQRLLIHAGDIGADLVVIGGYGHWRLREMIFGGVTREMVRAAPLPLLMSH